MARNYIPMTGSGKTKTGSGETHTGSGKTKTGSGILGAGSRKYCTKAVQVQKSYKNGKST